MMLTHKCMGVPIHDKPGKGLIHHSDRGSQYAGKEYQNLLNRYGMVYSMSRKDDYIFNQKGY